MTFPLSMNDRAKFLQATSKILRCLLLVSSLKPSAEHRVFTLLDCTLVIGSVGKVEEYKPGGRDPIVLGGKNKCALKLFILNSPAESFLIMTWRLMPVSLVCSTFCVLLQVV